MKLCVLRLHYGVIFLPLIKKKEVVIVAKYINSTQRLQGFSYTASIFRVLDLREAIYRGDAVRRENWYHLVHMNLISVLVFYTSLNFCISHIAVNWNVLHNGYSTVDKI
jgi:intein-encoded DNA endonuclease-like protein